LASRNHHGTSRGLAATQADLALAHAAAEPELAGHGRAEAVLAGADGGVTVLCTLSGPGGREGTVLVRLGPDGRERGRQALGPEHGAGRAMAALPGGGTVVAGELQRGPLEFAARLLWLDAADALVAERSPGETGNVGFTTVVVLRDGSVLAGGVRHGQGWLAGEHFERVVPHAAEIVALAAGADGGFALAGRRDPSTTAFGFALLAAHDADGGERWSHTLPADGRAEPAALVALPDRSVVAVGHWERDPRAPARLWLARVGVDGELVWERTVESAGPRRAAAAVALPGGDLAVAGYVADGGVRHPLVTRIAAGDGTPRWERTFAAEHELPSALAATPDGGLVLAGLRVRDGGRTSAFVRRLDGDGRELWARTPALGESRPHGH
jgi:hypothetical protein